MYDVKVFLVVPPHERSDLSSHFGVCAQVWLLVWLWPLAEFHWISKIPKPKCVPIQIKTQQSCD